MFKCLAIAPRNFISNFLKIFSNLQKQKLKKMDLKYSKNRLVFCVFENQSNVAFFSAPISIASVCVCFVPEFFSVEKNERRRVFQRTQKTCPLFSFTLTTHF